MSEWLKSVGGAPVWAELPPPLGSGANDDANWLMSDGTVSVWAKLPQDGGGAGKRLTNNGGLPNWDDLPVGGGGSHAFVDFLAQANDPPGPHANYWAFDNTPPVFITVFLNNDKTLITLTYSGVTISNVTVASSDSISVDNINVTGTQILITLSGWVAHTSAFSLDITYT